MTTATVARAINQEKFFVFAGADGIIIAPHWWQEDASSLFSAPHLRQFTFTTSLPRIFVFFLRL
jgi:hypothetical protein